MEYIDPLDEAIKLTVENYSTRGKRGAAALALAMNANHGTIKNKSCSTKPDVQFNIKEFRQVVNITGDSRALDVLNAECGKIAIDMPPEFAADMDVLEAWAEWNTDIGETSEAMKNALKAGAITQAHLKEIKREIREDFQRAMSLFKKIEAMAEPENKVVNIKA